MREFPVPLPKRMTHLPLDPRGFPIPAFVEHLPDGSRDFRIISPTHMARCVRQHRCWICGELLGGTFAFVLGPMCCVNGVNSEPPSHVDCASFAAVACPFLSQPLAKRNERGLADLEYEHGIVEAPGIMLKHNPTAACVWVTKGYKVTNVGNGVLFDVGPPERMEFYHRGRPASRSEVDRAIQIGLPKLRAAADKDGPKARLEMERRLTRLEFLLDRQHFAPEPLPDVDLASFAEVE